MKRAILIALALAACHPEPPPETRTERLQSVAREIVGRHLADPAAAQYLGVRVEDRNGITTVCGSVNERLDGGRYYGPRRFMVAGDAAFVEGEEDAAAFAYLWSDLCGVVDRLSPEGASGDGSPGVTPSLPIPTTATDDLPEPS